MLIGATGLAVDSASFHNQHVRMQSVADSTALAVAKELHLYRKNLGELKAAGEARAASMLAEAGLAENPRTIGISVDPEQNLIDIELAVAAHGFLPPEIWGENPIVVSAQAVAFGQAKLCVLALHGSKSDTIKAEGAALLTAPECAVQSNSKDPKGLNVASDSRIVSTLICSSGGVSGGGSSYEPAPETDCPALADPLTSRPAPSLSGCTYTDLVIGTSQQLPGNAVFCGGLKIEKGAVVTLSPGVYVISGGKLEVKDTSKLIGDYVSFYFQDDAALFKFEKDTTIDLSAPRTGSSPACCSSKTRSPRMAATSPSEAKMPSGSSAPSISRAASSRSMPKPTSPSSPPIP